jgi:small subunit ribosomal protein S17
MPKRVLEGVVVSDKQDKTVVVRVERRFTHPLLKKTVRRSKKFHAHDETNAARVGDIVTIEESRPYSKLKTWKLVGGAEPGRAVPKGGGDDEAKRSSGLVASVKSLVRLGGSKR